MNFHEHLKIHGFTKTQEVVHGTYKMFPYLDKESSEIIKQFHKDWKDYLETNSIPDPYK